MGWPWCRRDSKQLMSTSLGTAVRENKNPSSSLTWAFYERARLGWWFSGSHQNDDAWYSQGDDNILKGKQRPMSPQMWWVLQGPNPHLLLICFERKIPSQLSSEACCRSQHQGPCHLAPGSGHPGSGKVYLKMNDRDRIVPSLWSSCFLIWDCNKANAHAYWLLSNFKITNLEDIK